MKGRTNFVSFSGIDGAGKSTQIDALCARLRESGLTVRVIRFWDDIAQLKNVRETTGHKVFKGDKGVGSPDKPIERRDKNVKSFPMTCVRLFIYFVDALSTRRVFKKNLNSGEDLIIFDRYTFDEFANLTLSNLVIRAYVRMIMSFVPRPQISYFLDADPEKARARKPEYPLDFLYANRKAYLTLCELVGGITIIPAGSIAEVQQAVFAQARQKLTFRSPLGDGGQVGPAHEGEAQTA